MSKNFFIPQNDEHIEKLCDDMLKWAVHTSIPILADFLSRERLPWSVLRNLIEINQKVEYTFEISITYLVVKWYEKAKEDKPSKALLRLLSKYIDAYDLHLFYVDMQKRKIMTDKLMSVFEEKNWSKDDVPEPFKTIYEQNKK